MDQNNIIARHTIEKDGKKNFNIITCIQELDARMKTLVLQIQELQEAVKGCATIISELESKQPKIDIVSPDQAKIILNNK